MRNTSIYQENSGFREVFPHIICPFCPVILDFKRRNYLINKALLNVRQLKVDI
jgi:hypothetical protein